MWPFYSCALPRLHRGLILMFVTYHNTASWQLSSLHSPFLIGLLKIDIVYYLSPGTGMAFKITDQYIKSDTYVPTCHRQEHVNAGLCPERLPGILFVLGLILGMQSHQTSLCFCERLLGPPLSCCGCWLSFRPSVSSKQHDKLKKRVQSRGRLSVPVWQMDRHKQLEESQCYIWDSENLLLIQPANNRWLNSFAFSNYFFVEGEAF